MSRVSLDPEGGDVPTYAATLGAAILLVLIGLVISEETEPW
jgi:hypothetical protein